jgi:hypothetical protein
MPTAVFITAEWALERYFAAAPIVAIANSVLLKEGFDLEHSYDHRGPKRRTAWYMTHASLVTTLSSLIRS